MNILRFFVFSILVILTACTNAQPSATSTAPISTPIATRTNSPLPTAVVVETKPNPTAMDQLKTIQKITWHWVSFTSPVEQYEIENPESYTMTFNEDGTLNIVADCNNAIGSYTDEDGALSIEIGPMTLAACPEGSRSDQFIQYLGYAAIYFFQDGHLFIDMFADGGTLEFKPIE